MDNQDLSIPTLPSVPPGTRSPGPHAVGGPAGGRGAARGGLRRTPPGTGRRHPPASSAASPRRSRPRWPSSSPPSRALILLLPKAKLLTTAGTAMVSVAAYALFWGWTFAVGFVVLLFVHEMGHVMQLRREGIKASAPMFIPFLGADDQCPLARRERPRRGPCGACRTRPGDARSSRLPGHRRGHQQRPAARPRLRGLLPEPVQPAAGRAPRRRAGDGGDGPVDVVPGLRRAGGDGDPGRRTRSC